MAKDPAFLFYTNDFMSGTQFFTDEQVGKYMRLLMAQHQHGHLSENQVIIICKSYDKDIMSKFAKDIKGLWFNERLEIEIEKRKSFVESRSKNKQGKTKAKIISSSYDNHMENVNEDVIKISKELCKIFGKDYQAPADRMPTESNWYKTIEGQAIDILTVWKPPEAAKQIQGYLRYCKSNDRKTIGTNYKAAETILSSNWLELLGENKSRAPNEFIAAEVDLQNLTREAWMNTYGWHMKNNEAFKKHFDGKLLPSQPVGKHS